MKPKILMLQKISGIYVSIPGPGSQQVANQWNSANDWFMMLTQQGYIVACVDGRGTGFKGADFKKVTQLN
jgi:dipeptidyl-peptidase-4